MHQRGLTPVLGLVLLVGITAVASMALLFVGMSLADATQSSAEHEQAEQSMSQLAESGDQIAVSDARRAEFSIRGADSASVRAISDTGTINITVRNRTTDSITMTMERDLGAVIYEADDGTQVAYQGGGVWRMDPNGRSSMVRPPEFHYRANPHDTITFPVMLVREDFTTSAPFSGDLVARASDRHYPDRPSHYNPLTDGSVRIRIDSEYCQGWEAYFADRTDGSPAEGCDAGTKGELEIQFSVPFELNGIGSGVMLGNYDSSEIDDDFDGVDESDIEDSADAPSATPMVEERFEDAHGGEGQVLPAASEINESGLYYDDGNLSATGNVEFNTSDGDIEVVSQAYPVFDGKINVTGDNNVTFYVQSNIVDNGGGNERIGSSDAADQLRVFVHSDVDEIGHNGQNTHFHGLLYAPNSHVNLFSGNKNASGALVAESYDFGNSNEFEFEIDPDVADLQFYRTVGDAPFYYLHISETEVHVEQD